MENERVILGLDVSTATIGICLMSVQGENREILKLTHVTPKISSKIKGIEALFLKRKIFEDEFLNQYQKYNITDVIIEEPLLSSNNVNTISVLLKFNGMISDSIYRAIDIVPKFISSYDARKYSFPELLTIRKFNKKGETYTSKVIKKAIKDNNLVLFGSYAWDIAKKDVMLGLFSDKYPDIPWIYDKNNELKKENFDASDSAICCLGYLNKELYGVIEPKIVDSVENKNEITYNVSIWDREYKHQILID